MDNRTVRKPFFVLIAAAVLVIASLTACAASTPQAGPSSPNVEAPLEVQRVTLEESKAAFDNNTAIFLDVRNENPYAASHIPEAISIPLEELRPRIDELDPDQWIITYCTWPAEESSARAAEILLQNGFTRVNPILGGFDAWTNAGYPVESSQ